MFDDKVKRKIPAPPITRNEVTTKPASTTPAPRPIAPPVDGTISNLPEQRPSIKLTPAKQQKATAPAPAMKTYEVSKTISDTPYGWTSAYTVQKTSTEYSVIIKAKLTPATGVTKEQTQKVKDNTSLEFRRYWDSRFQLKDKEGKSLPLRASLKYVTDKAHLNIALNPGSGRDNLTTWYVDSVAQDRAHELGHQLGMKDEYVDSTAPSRATAAASGVKTDNSLMGNYYEEGEGKADVKLRHGKVLAQAIGGAMGRTLTAEMSTTYIVRSGDTLKSLALRLFGDEKKADNLYKLNQGVIPADKKIKPGMTLRIK